MEGDLVIIKVLLSPLTWKTARMVAVFPGENVVMSVADVNLITGVILRWPVVKLCSLPLID